MPNAKARRLHCGEPYRPGLVHRCTTNLPRRLAEHRKGEVIHTAKYRIDRLIYVEPHETAPDAIAREKQLKNWNRGKKIALINLANPDWRDLSGEIHDYG